MNERDYSLILIDEIEKRHVRITPPECANIVLDVIQFFWETPLDAPSLMRQQVLWYQVLKDHSLKTINRVAMDWLKNAKRKPTPADFLELANEIDETPEQLLRLKIISKMPLQVVQPQNAWDDWKMVGCPIRLASLMRQAKGLQMRFTEKDQNDYLRTGVEPSWTHFDIPEKALPQNGPSREELLAMMSPEARIAALAKPDWKRASKDEV